MSVADMRAALAARTPAATTPAPVVAPVVPHPVVAAAAKTSDDHCPLCNGDPSSQTWSNEGVSCLCHECGKTWSVKTRKEIKPANRAGASAPTFSKGPRVEQNGVKKPGPGKCLEVWEAMETLATLIYLNQLTAKVLDGVLNFHSYSKKTAVLLLGSRNQSTNHSAISILTVLQKCADRYDFIEEFYALLSECAHPNHEGLIMGYSRPDMENHIENFASAAQNGRTCPARSVSG